MNQTQKDALKLVLELAEQNALNPEDAETEELYDQSLDQFAALVTVRKMLGKVDVNPEPLIDQVEGPILIADFLHQIGHNLSAEAATASCLITFHRRGSGPHTVTNPNGTFIVGDFVTCGGRTYSITGE